MTDESTWAPRRRLTELTGATMPRDMDAVSRVRLGWIAIAAESNV